MYDVCFPIPDDEIEFDPDAEYDPDPDFHPNPVDEFFAEFADIDFSVLHQLEYGLISRADAARAAWYRGDGGEEDKEEIDECIRFLEDLFSMCPFYDGL